MENFEPVIVAFCCHYCAYTAADMAGSKRLCYPSNVKIIRVPCAGKVDAIHIMKALEMGYHVLLEKVLLRSSTQRMKKHEQTLQFKA